MLIANMKAPNNENEVELLNQNSNADNKKDSVVKRMLLIIRRH